MYLASVLSSIARVFHPYIELIIRSGAQSVFIYFLRSNLLLKVNAFAARRCLTFGLLVK
jgi:hypothetical protein